MSDTPATKELLIGCGNSCEKTKVCTKCGLDLPVSRFNKANWIASGLRSDCKDCYKITKKAHWDRKGLEVCPNAPRRRALKLQKQIGLRTCVKCSNLLPATDEFFSSRPGWMDTTCRDCARSRSKSWAEDNPEKAKVTAYASCARRYASKRNRTPNWLNDDQRAAIREIYRSCKDVSRLTGKKHHVDHVVPLVGKTVCGLHVPWNLQILTEHENCTKSRKWGSE